MRLADTSTELTFLRTICDAKEASTRGLALAAVDANHFTGAAREVFDRLKNLLAHGKKIPSFTALKSDLVLSEMARTTIAADGACYATDDLQLAATTLEKHRKVRILYQCVVKATNDLAIESPDVDALISQLSNSLQRCHTVSSEDEMHRLSAATAGEWTEKLMADFNNQEDDIIGTGFRKFDSITGGIRRKNVLVMASNPGGGKSALALFMAASQYVMGYNVCYISYEMDSFELMYRLLSSISYIDHAAINLKRLTKEQKRMICERFEEWLQHGSDRGNQFVFWTPNDEHDIPEIAARIKHENFDIVYVDYLGLLKSEPGKAMHEVLGDHTRQAKLCANSLNAVFVLLAQYDDETNKIKYSKAITANANFIWSWIRGEKERKSNIIEVNMTKARNSTVYSFLLQTDLHIFRFSDYEGSLVPTGSKPTTEELPAMKELKN